MTKRRLGAFLSRLTNFLKLGVAAALCLGTLGLALTTVDVLPAAAVAVPVVAGVSPAGGLPAGGNSVTITGSGLTSATAVHFGTTLVSPPFTSNSGTKIVLVAPAGALGSVDVTVTTAGGTSAVNAKDTYTYANAPTVTALHGDSAPTTGGNTLIIDGTNFGSSPTVKFNTTAATSITVLSSTQIEAVTPPEPAADNTVPPTIYNVTVTTPSGTSATSTASNFYWFGSGACSFSGTGVENAGAPPGASAYIQEAAPGPPSGRAVADFRASNSCPRSSSRSPLPPLRSRPGPGRAGTAGTRSGAPGRARTTISRSRGPLTPHPLRASSFRRRVRARPAAVPSPRRTATWR